MFGFLRRRKGGKEVFDQIGIFMTGAFSFVAALAWNDAVQSLVRKLFGDASGTGPKFVYAFLVTALMVFATARITRVIAKLKGTQE